MQITNYITTNSISVDIILYSVLSCVFDVCYAVFRICILACLQISFLQLWMRIEFCGTHLDIVGAEKFVR